MRLFLSLRAWILRAACTSQSDLALENLALRQQLATYARSQKRPRLRGDRRRPRGRAAQVRVGGHRKARRSEQAALLDLTT